MSIVVTLCLVAATVFNYYMDWRWKRSIEQRLKDIRDEIETLKKAA